MSVEAFESVFPVFDRVLPIGRYKPGIFLSCLYEPTIAKSFFEIISKLPKNARKKVFFTTNLAVPMSKDDIKILSRANVHHINISIETLKEERYPLITGAKLYTSFMNNLNNLAAAMHSWSYHPKIYVITMALTMNKDEIEDIFKFAWKKFHCTHHDVRTPYIALYSNMDWCAEQLLPAKQADSLREKLSRNPFIKTDIRNIKDFRIFEDQVADKESEQLNKIEMSEKEKLLQELDFCMQEEYLFLRFDADGTVTEKVTGLKEKIPEINSASDYYYEKLKKLYDRKIKAFAFDNSWTGYENAKRIKIKVVLERRTLNEKALILRGWYSAFDDIKEEMICIIRTESGRYFRVYPISNDKLRTKGVKNVRGFEVWIDRCALGKSTEKLCLCFADFKNKTIKYNRELPYLVYR